MRLATLGDVYHVGETMWARGREELNWLGVGQREWVEAWKERIARGDAVCFDGHAILGWNFESPDVVNTSFQASASFELPGIGKSVTKALRHEIPRLMEERKVRLFNTYSLCVDPQAPKWFRLLGLEEDKEYRGIRRGPYVSRRFFRRA